MNLDTYPRKLRDLEEGIKQSKRTEVTAEEAVQILQYGYILPKPKLSPVQAKSFLWDAIFKNDLRFTSDRKIKIVEHIEP